ncbi:MAG: AmmeMemoRadiSam system protein B [Mailhella sp.]|nr:AmmeMemoRadiSam system protein B [Mailhella sp.]
MEMKAMIREPYFAGSFYEGKTEALRAGMDLCFAGKKKDAEKIRPKMLLLPHAGHVYSGPVIAETLSRVDLPKRMIILCPSHTGRGKHLGVWPAGSWKIPGAEIPVDAELADALTKGGHFVPDMECHKGEHSAEVLLPFLLRQRPDMTFVPAVLSSLKGIADAARDLAAVLRDASGGSTPCVVVSSDMNHYADDAETRRKDGLAVEKLLALDAQGLLDTVRDNNISMCGILPALAAIMAIRENGAVHAELAAYDTSASAFGEKRRCVGYAGVIAY